MVKHEEHRNQNTTCLPRGDSMPPTLLGWILSISRGVCQGGIRCLPPCWAGSFPYPTVEDLQRLFLPFRGTGRKRSTRTPSFWKQERRWILRKEKREALLTSSLSWWIARLQTCHFKRVSISVYHWSHLRALYSNNFCILYSMQA